MGKTLSKVLGVGPVKYNAVEADAYRGFGFPGADEMGNMFQAYRDFEKEVLANRSARDRAQAEPFAADVRAVRRQAEERDSARDGLSAPAVSVDDAPRGGQTLRAASSCLASRGASRGPRARRTAPCAARRLR